MLCSMQRQLLTSPGRRFAAVRERLPPDITPAVVRKQLAGQMAEECDFSGTATLNRGRAPPASWG